ATNPIFRLGVGTLSLSGGMAIADRFALPAVAYDSIYITADNDSIFTNSNSVYYFTSLTGDALSAAKTAVAPTDPNALWLDSTALDKSTLGIRRRTVNGFEYTTTGFSLGSGDIVWKVTGDRVGTINNETLDWSNGRAVVFYGVSNPTLANTTPEWLSESASIQFKGANSFSHGLVLSTRGSISQAEASSLTVTGGNLSITQATSVALNNGGNSLGTVGAITTTGNLSLMSQGALTVSGNLVANSGTVTIGLVAGSSLHLTGNINSQGAISITSMGSATVTASGTMSTTAGLVTLSLGDRSSATLGGAITTQGKVQLGLGRDSSLTVSNISTDGEIAISLGTRGTMALSGDLLAKGLVDLSFGAGSTLTVTKALRSTGTGVTVELNDGTYDNLNGEAATASNGLTWTHEATNLTLNLGKVRVG
ncbi:MAG: hypothetical protein ORO03_06745, partial [Alphaproteobacteria bacterium]|nr:hypothetical protein [Alphaproteobacteria bacterium]